MKHFVINSTKDNSIRWHSWYNYIIDLDREIWSLYDYLNFSNPNYITFNEADLNQDNSGQYYSIEELEVLGIIKKVLFTNIEQDDHSFSSATEGEEGILIFPGKLPFHKGIINNFSEYPVSNVVLCFIPPEELFRQQSGWGAYPVTKDTDDNWIINHYQFLSLGKEISGFAVVNGEDHFKFNNTETDHEWRLVSYNDEGVMETIEVSAADLRLVDGVGNVISFIPEVKDSTAIRNPVQIFPEAYTIVSLAKASAGVDNANNSVRRDPSNYFLGAFSGNAAFYLIDTSSVTNNTFQSTWKYIPSDANDYNTTFFNLVQPRSFIHITSSDKTSFGWNLWSGSTRQVVLKSRDVWANKAKTLIGSENAIWTLYDVIDYDLLYTTETDSNSTTKSFTINPIDLPTEVIKRATTNVANEAVAEYSIMMKDYTNSFYNNIHWMLW